jgi:hypothetical protein
MPEKLNKEQEGETVEVKRSEIKSLLDRIQKLENPNEIDLDEPKVHYVNVKLHDGKPISRVYDVKRKGIDPVTKDELLECSLDIVAEKGIEKVTANYLEMIRDYETVKCELVKRIEKDVSFSQGKVAVQTENNYNMIPTGIMVPLKVKMVETSYLVKFPDGKEVELKQVNI